jgi:hypothetical protein
MTATVKIFVRLTASENLHHVGLSAGVVHFPNADINISIPKALPGFSVSG